MVGIELKIEGQTICASQEDGVLTWMHNISVNSKFMMILFGSNGIKTDVWYDNESNSVRSYEINIVEMSQVSDPIRIKNKETEKLLEEYYIMEKELKERGLI